MYWEKDIETISRKDLEAMQLERLQQDRSAGPRSHIIMNGDFGNSA